MVETLSDGSHSHRTACVRRLLEALGNLTLDAFHRVWESKDWSPIPLYKNRFSSRTRKKERRGGGGIWICMLAKEHAQAARQTASVPLRRCSAPIHGRQTWSSTPSVTSPFPSHHPHVWLRKSTCTKVMRVETLFWVKLPPVSPTLLFDDRPCFWHFWHKLGSEASSRPCPGVTAYLAWIG